MTELPLACALDAGALGVRVDEIRGLFADALDGWEHDGDRLTLRFAAGAGDRVEALAAAERECCGFLAISVRPGPVLVLEASAGAGETLAGFAELASEARPG